MSDWSRDFRKRAEVRYEESKRRQMIRIAEETKKLFCSNKECEKYIDYYLDWVCPWCEAINGIKQTEGILFLKPGCGYYEPCKKCGKLAAYAICPHCEEKILINDNGDKQKAIKIYKGFFAEVGKSLDEAGKKQDEKRENNSGKTLDELTVDDFKQGKKEILDIAQGAAEIFGMIKDTIDVVTGKKDPRQLQLELLKHEHEKEDILSKIRKIRGEDKKEESAFSEYEKQLKDLEEREKFKQKEKIIKAKGKLEGIRELEKMKVEALQKMIERYLKENNINDAKDLPVEILLRLKQEIQETEDMFDKMMSEVRRAASV